MPTPRPPKLRTLEQRYAAKINHSLSRVWATLHREVFPLIEDPEERRDDTDLVTLAAVFDRVRVGIISQARPTVEGIATAINANNKEREFRILRVNPFETEPWLIDLAKGWVVENVALIESVDQSLLTEVEKLINRMTRDGEPKKAVEKSLREQFALTKDRARLIARDQVNKFNGRLTEERQTRLGVTEYIWHTVQDQRTRDDHRKLDGKTFRWDDPPITVSAGKRAGETNHPGGDIQCRCWAEPILKRRGFT